jgi:hypothetical protein
LGRTSVWQLFVFLVTIKSRYLKIKNSKNRLGLVLLLLKVVQNYPNLNLQNPKKGGYEVGVRVRVCD